jgi:glyoxalase-like protein
LNLRAFYRFVFHFVLGVGVSMAVIPPAKHIKVDHASVCGSHLEALQKSFASVGLAADYGGPHAHGGTQMALLGFEDGSYLELIAPKQGGSAGDSSWGKMIAGDAGPCAWAIGSSDLGGDIDQLKERGMAVEGPSAGSRTRPDGKVIEWETAAVGMAAPGSVLPFIIQDKTPRQLRVQPSASVKGSGLKGIEIVVIGVKDLEAATALFRRAYGWIAPTIEDHKEFGARLAYFSGSPVILAAAVDDKSWLTERLQKFGESPVAYLLGASDLKRSRFALSPTEKWFGRNVNWFDATSLGGIRLGVVQ